MKTLKLESECVGKRYNFGGLQQDLRYRLDFAVPASPAYVDAAWPGVSVSTRLPPRNTFSLGVDDERRKSYAIGIVADIHQNSLMFQKVLEHFAELDVLALFCLGDYSYTRQPDAGSKRAAQTGRVFTLIRSWLDENPDRQAVVLLGNHEIDPRYYASSVSHECVRQVVAKHAAHPRLFMPADPFLSYESDNAVDVLVVSAAGYRTFRLCHAVTKEFVTALYLGLDDKAIKDGASRIITTLGNAWLALQVPRREEVQLRWNAFLKHPRGSEDRAEAALVICEHIREELTADSFLTRLSNSCDNFSRIAASYQFMIDMCSRHVVPENLRENFGNFWNVPNYVEADWTGLEFARDLRKLYASLGYGKMYSVCGHFHADLGAFGACREFGTCMICPAGFQLGKIIGKRMSAYMIECSFGEDAITRVFCEDDEAIIEDECDLSTDADCVT